MGTRPVMLDPQPIVSASNRYLRTMSCIFFVFDILSHDFPYLKPSLYFYTTNGSQLTESPV